MLPQKAPFYAVPFLRPSAKSAGNPGRQAINSTKCIHSAKRIHRPSGHPQAVRPSPAQSASPGRPAINSTKCPHRPPGHHQHKVHPQAARPSTGRQAVNSTKCPHRPSGLPKMPHIVRKRHHPKLLQHHRLYVLHIGFGDITRNAVVLVQ